MSAAVAIVTTCALLGLVGLATICSLELLRSRRRRARLVEIAPCAGWVARYRHDDEDLYGSDMRMVAAWGLVEAGDGSARVVGLTSNYEPGSYAARQRTPQLVVCSDLPDFVGYDRDGCVWP